MGRDLSSRAAKRLIGWSRTGRWCSSGTRTWSSSGGRPTWTGRRRRSGWRKP